MCGCNKAKSSNRTLNQVPIQNKIISSFNLYRIIVLPAASSHTIRILISSFHSILAHILEIMLPIFIIVDFY